MNIFLEKCRLNLTSPNNTINIVIGNESCDLDSAVSAIVYAYFIHHLTGEPVVPVLNIPQEEYPLKTEVTYYLKKHNIYESNLVFRNHINLESLSCENKLKLHLTDHHELRDIGLNKSVVGVIDHRPKAKTWDGNVHENIQIVGSCCTLVAKEILDQKPEVLTNEIAELLYGVIVLDTINFSAEAKRVTPLDIEIAAQLKTKFNLTYDDQQLFNELMDARKDISQLTTLQLLSKDLKIVKNVAIPGFPLLVAQFLQRGDVLVAMKQFCSAKKCVVAILIGLIFEGEQVTRDLAVYCDSDEYKALAKRIIQNLSEAPNLNLKLERVNCELEHVTLFKQANYTVTRKVILPVVEKTLIED